MPVTWYNNYVCADLRPEDHYMANKYNAFISYRHAPEDIKIASEVQRSLERFNIPPAIQQKTGIKRFERVFRDKEELPITADLNDDIDEAIKNSDNLIVICSTRTNESIWVRKEIETFLKYHTKKEIFTVLVDGEPEDVIPDILQHDTITIKKADGTTETREALIEPLSCDYRIGIKKARKVELPRLAASLLGCSYDELVQRRRQYERRRNAIIGTISACAGLCIMAYLVWSLMQIRMNYDLAQQNYQLAQDNYMLAQANYETAQANYRESLRNQSDYLATVSGQLLERGDRVSAILLALSALPSEGNDRPVTTRAEYALTNALSCYLTPGAFAMEPVWRYSTAYTIEKYFVTQDQTRLIALDACGDVTIWSLSDHSVYKVIPREGRETQDIAINREGILVINYEKKLIAYDASYENVLWSLELDEDHVCYSKTKSLQMITEGKEILFAGQTHAMVLDVLTGSVELDLNIRSEEEENSFSIYAPYITALKASKDGHLIAVVSSKYQEAPVISVYDRDASEFTPLSETFGQFFSMRFTEDNDLIISYEKESSDIGSFQIGSAAFLTSSIRTTAKFDVTTGKEEWEADVPYTLSYANTQIHFCDFDKSGEMIPAVCAVFSNKLYMFDLATGKVLFDTEMLGENVYSYLTDNGKGIVLVLRSGKYVYAPFSSDGLGIVSYDYFKDGLCDVAACYSEEEDDVHFLINYSDDTGIIEYDSEFYDTGFHTIEGIEEGDQIRQALQCGDKILFLGSSMNLYCYDASAGKIEWKTVVDGDSYVSVRLIYAASDGKAYFVNRNSLSEDDLLGDKLFMVDTSDGTISRVEGIPCSGTITECCVDDKMFISAIGYGDLPSGIYIYDCIAHTSERVEVADDEAIKYGLGRLAVSPDGKKAIYICGEFMADNETAYFIDLESGSYTETACAGGSFAVWDEASEKYAIGCGNYVNMYDITDGIFLTIPKGDSEIENILFCDKGLIVCSQTGILTLYDLDGNMNGSIQLEGNPSVTYDNSSLSLTEDDLLVTCGECSNLVDMEEFEMRTTLYGLKCFDRENGRFYVKSYMDLPGTSAVLYYDRLSVEEMIERGVEYVGSETLSEEMKNMYGIS